MTQPVPTGSPYLCLAHGNHGPQVADTAFVAPNSSLIAAGTVVFGGTRVPPGSLLTGIPGRVQRELTEQERAVVRAHAEKYVELSREHLTIAAAR